MAVVFTGVVKKKRNTEAYWNNDPPDLLPGETVLETDTKRSKTNNHLSATQNWADLAYDAVGPAGARGLNAAEEWLAREGNEGLDIEDYDAFIQGDDGEDGDNAAFLKGDTVPVDGIATTQVFFRTLA